jgi:secreted PhoX family phosphatase
VRNHELRTADANPLKGANPYDPTQVGGTTALVVGSDRRLIRDYVTSSGMVNNCAGGGTPWGTWLTCEEDRTTIGAKDHGYFFEVNPNNPESRLSKTPVVDMGRISHEEAVDIDPRTGIAYLTEDDFEGLIDDDDPNADTRRSYFYRFLPNNRRARPGALQEGGTLQVAKLDEAPADADFIDLGQRFTVRWITVNPETPRDDALAVDATRFNRLEGLSLGAGRSGSTTPLAAKGVWVRSTPTSPHPTLSSCSTRARIRTASRARTTSPSPPGATCGWSRTATTATAS